ncbi:MAG: esterase [Candidatus Dactylopiibacterium carminicum]|uniref:Esterase n=1 Tax=Candidatus Dactylopiibacterium carminicum TaxID=857335 RepID=A0A272EP41_9RHOO|nr:patatin-like phospholipase family protein [Candidatus Dactylopiibacterium carminicum]KAF7598238.1 esterase [Candidatus Dactylopiibacterium carminicum]PAS91892.1 MAG: esterase [Candidatus Dactylopiibacterium carminicum]PAS94868.1 MAG: esterase [Candidatus Dactylopiibacterium carminicum]PAS97081.1 MAG: esterase [Candidatus Dactylopiibacterium carminicum]
MFGHDRGSHRVMSLALQGGGAHGAYTWGVLDALLEDGRFSFEGISGSSAGAMNAVALAHGFLLGGHEGAREALAGFWDGVAMLGSPELVPPVFDASLPPPGASWMMQLSRWLSPYQLNPLAINPLRDLVESQFDFERLQEECPFELFVAATHANTGELRLFRNNELIADALLASACLPSMHQTVIIDGEPYWDGAYAANPAVFPLLRFCDARDVLLVLLSPLRYERTPRGADEIQQRTLDLAFSNAFRREMRLLAAMREMAIESGWLSGTLEQRLLSLRFHLIDGEAALGKLAFSSKVVANQAFLHRLRDAGRSAAQQWLAAHGEAVGHRASVDIERIFLPAR